MTTTPVSMAESKERAADYLGFTASTRVTAGNRSFDIPNPGLLDDDQQDRWEDLQFELEQYDRDDSGDLITPYRKDGRLITPSYNARLGVVLFGEDGYAEFKAGGGSGSQIALEWARMNAEFEKRGNRG